jgi:2-oxoglutarate dehydrogenase E2 component (dihydrolipoamide succinyltransferase)
MAIEIRVPTLGESITEATVGKWFKKAGEPVQADEPLVELETDKVTLEVNAPSPGVLSEIVAETGQTVAIGALLGQVASVAATPAAAPASAAPASCAPSRRLPLRQRHRLRPRLRPRCRLRQPRPRSPPRTRLILPRSPVAASGVRC